MTSPDASAAPALRPTQPLADVWLAEVRVSNFRNIVEAHVPLERGATFLVGENNAGKSSFLLAIATACGIHRATRDDLHRTGETIASDATVDLIIRSADDEFAEVCHSAWAGTTVAGRVGRMDRDTHPAVGKRRVPVSRLKAKFLDLGR